MITKKGGPALFQLFRRLEPVGDGAGQDFGVPAGLDIDRHVANEEGVVRFNSVSFQCLIDDAGIGLEAGGRIAADHFFKIVIDAADLQYGMDKFVALVGDYDLCLVLEKLKRLFDVRIELNILDVFKIMFVINRLRRFNLALSLRADRAGDERNFPETDMAADLAFRLRRIAELGEHLPDGLDRGGKRIGEGAVEIE